MADDTVALPRDSRKERRELTKLSSGGRSTFIVLRGSWGREIDRQLVRWTGWSMITWQYTRVSGRPYQPTLLLTTVGRKSGRLRVSALPYYRVGDELVVCGSRGGGPRDPLWAANVEANSSCWLRIRRKLIPATGRVAGPEERPALFEQVAALHGKLRWYQEQASTHGREVPLVVLTPKAPIPGD